MIDNISKKFILAQKDFLYSLEPIYGIKYNNNQHGGTIVHKTYNFMENSFNMKIDDDDLNNIIITIVSKDEIDCITVFIRKDENIAIIHNVSYYENCAREGLKKPGGGDILFRMILTYLIKNKEKYKIKRIILTDHSFLACSEENNIRVKLSQLRMITHGKTWYMKYGFKPYDSFKMKPDTGALRLIEHNNKVLSKLKTKSVKVMKKASKFSNLKLKEIENLENEHLLFKDFIIALSKEFNKYCPLIESLLDKVYAPLEDGRILLHDFYNKHYYLDIF